MARRQRGQVGPANAVQDFESAAGARSAPTRVSGCSASPNGASNASTANPVTAIVTAVIAGV